MLTRRQYIEYKLKYIQKVAASETSDPNTSRAKALAQKSALLSELSELQTATDAAIREYEHQFGEKFVRPVVSNDSPQRNPSRHSAPHGNDHEHGFAPSK
jgi:hypothetical protein